MNNPIPPVSYPQPMEAQPLQYPAPAPPVSYQPYGAAIPAFTPPAKYRFLAFGIPYAVVNACLIGLLFLVLLFVASGSARDVDAEAYQTVKTASTWLAVVVLVLGTVAAAASVFCIAGRVLGWWIGFIHVCVLAVLQLVSVVIYAVGDDSTGFRLAGMAFVLFIYGALIALGVLDFKRYRAHLDTLERERLRAERARASQSWVGPADPLTRRKQPPAEPAKPGRPDPSAAVQDAVQLLAAVASVEPALAAPRLLRAAQAVVQVLGPAAGASARQWLDKPMQVDDLEAVIEMLAPALARNPRMAQGVVKCALLAVRDEDGTTTPAADLAVAQVRSRVLG